MFSSRDLTAGFPVPAGLLSSFVEVESIKRHFKSRLVGTVLNGYLCLRKLVLQRTKLIDETQDMLLEMLEDMTTGNPIWQLGAGEVHMCVVSQCHSPRGRVTNPTFGERSPSQEHCGTQCYGLRAGLMCTFPGLSSEGREGVGGLRLVLSVTWSVLILYVSGLAVFSYLFLGHLHPVFLLHYFILLLYS